MYSKYLIYGLVDPRDGNLRYIGKSCQGINRAREHAYPSYLSVDKSYCGNWIRKLQQLGLTFSWVVIQEFQDSDILSNAESHWISYFRSIGCQLTNLTLGGEGTPGYHPNLETRNKISVALKGKTRSKEHCDAISKGKRGKSLRVHSEEWNKKISDSHKSSAKSKQNSERRQRKIIDQYGAVYASIKHAAYSLGVKAPNISAILSGSRKSIKGFRFSYINSWDPAKIIILRMISAIASKPSARINQNGK